MITLGNISLNDVDIANGPLTFFPDPGLVQTLELSFYADQAATDATVIIETTPQSDLVLACADDDCQPQEEEDREGYVNALAFAIPVFQERQSITLRFFVKSIQFNSSGVAAAVYVYFTDARGDLISEKRALGGLLLA